MDAFGVFEGGGVRGYAHVGALNAFEERGVRFIGVAGTSVGAIVAALVAVGYTSDDLFAIDGAGRETGLLAEDLGSVLLRRRELARARRAAKMGTWIRSAGGAFANNPFARRLTPLSALAKRLFHGNLEIAAATAVPSSIVAVALSAPHWMLLRNVWAKSGIVATDRLKTWIDDLLAMRLGCNPNVTFAQMPMPIMIVATDLTLGRPAIFSRETHPDMSVAAAVVASASYPLFFEPALIDGSIYVDGGIVSNFPAWALDNLRAEQDRTLPTFGFRLASETLPTGRAWPGGQRPQLVETVKRTIGAAMDGHTALETRRIDDLHPIVAHTDIGILDLHTIVAERGNLYRKGREGVQSYFRSRLGPQPPERMEGLLRALIDIAARLANASGVVRAYIIQPIDEQFCRVVYSAMLEGDADDAMLLRRGSANQALCIDRREPILMRVEDLDTTQMRSPSTKYVHALRPDEVRHAYCIPMFETPNAWAQAEPSARSEPLAALCFDFRQADDLLLLDPRVEDGMAALGHALVDLWKDRESSRLEPAEVIEPAAGDWTPSVTGPGFYVSGRKTRGRPEPSLQDRIDTAIVRASA